MTTSGRKRRWTTRVVWVVAVIACLAGLSELIKSATFPRAVAKHPVRTEATVTDVYINGLGGDAAVDYRYQAAGHIYSGSGNGQLGHEELLSLRPGDRVAIEYAARVPSESCTCDAASELPPSVPLSILIAALLTLPVAVLLWRSVPRWYRTRASWFVPVHGVGEWVGFLGGVVCVLIVLAYLFAPSVGG